MTSTFTSNETFAALVVAVFFIDQVMLTHVTFQVTDINDSRVKYIDVTSVFNGHRFCEDGMSKGDQWVNNDVWLWNLNPPFLDPNPGPFQLNEWLGAGLQQGGTPFTGSVSLESQGSTGSGVGWTARPFHPKQGGSQAIRDLIIQNAKNDKIPGVVGTSPRVCIPSRFISICTLRRALGW